jgi:hypothetical protein
VTHLHGRSADTPYVTLTTGRIALLLVAAALGFVGWRVLAPAEKQASTAVSNGATTLLTQPDNARFTVATANLELQRQTTGSYVGAAMPPGLALIRSDAATYCVQLADGGPVSHLQGPGGVATVGAC